MVVSWFERDCFVVASGWFTVFLGMLGRVAGESYCKLTEGKHTESLRDHLVVGTG